MSHERQQVNELLSLYNSCPCTYENPEPHLLCFITDMLVLDASESMLSKWDNDLRINIAKDKVAAFVDSLRRNPNAEMALRVYGHQFDFKQKNCTDSHAARQLLKLFFG
ncbi:hypothetical protein [Rhodoflexus sp.]